MIFVVFAVWTLEYQKTTKNTLTKSCGVVSSYHIINWSEEKEKKFNN